MNRTHAWRVMIIVGLILFGAVARPAAAESWTSEERELLRSAAEAMEAGAFEDARVRYEQVASAHPGHPDLAYNAGVAAYRSGALEPAREYFSRAMDAADPALQSKAAYGLGTTLSAQRMNDAETVTPEASQEAIKGLEQALRHYRRALRADPTNEAARVNGELTQQRLRELRAQPPQPEPQPSPDGEPSEDPSDASQGESDQSQAGPPEEGESESSPGQEQEGSDAPESDEAEPSDANESPDDGADPSGADSEPSPASPGEADGEEEGQAPDQLTESEAERLLQQVRDRERQRRQEQARRRRSYEVERDW